jgi:hypothetical protein
MGKDYRKLEFEEREIVLRVEFTDLDDERCLEASLRFLIAGPRAPREGEWVYLLDHRGNGCLGQIDSISGWMARVRPDWDSWKGDRPPPV